VALAEEFVEWRKAKASPDTTRDFDTGKLVTDDMPQ
jgi:hypothetical protein